MIKRTGCLESEPTIYNVTLVLDGTKCANDIPFETYAVSNNPNVSYSLSFVQTLRFSAESQDFLEQLVKIDGSNGTVIVDSESVKKMTYPDNLYVVQISARDELTGTRASALIFLSIMLSNIPDERGFL